VQAHVYQQYSSLVLDQVSVVQVDKFVVLSQKMKCFTKVVSFSGFQDLGLLLRLQRANFGSKLQIYTACFEHSFHLNCMQI